MNRSHSSPVVACGVSYLSLVLGSFGLLEDAREAVCDIASRNLDVAGADRVREFVECPFCISWYLALIVTRGRPLKALQLAGLASIPTSIVLAATKG